MILAKQILAPIIFAAFVAILLSPVCSWLEKNKIPRPVASVISLLIAVIAISGVITFFLIQSSNFSNDLPRLNENIESLLNKTKGFLGQYISDSHTLMQLDNTKEIAGMIIENNQKMVPNGLAALGVGFIQATLFLAFVTMFLIYRDKIFKFLRTIFKFKHKDVGGILLRLKKVVQGYIIGILLVVLVLTVCNSIALYALGIKHALFFAVFAACLNIVPFVGPLVGSILPALFALVTKDSLWYPFGIIIYFVVIQSFESYLITPKIVGSKVSVNPMFTILAIFTGNLIWGVTGMILFIPFTALLKQIFEEVEFLHPYAYFIGDKT